MRKLLPLVMVLVGLAIGAGAGFALRPVPEAQADAEAAPPVRAEPRREPGSAGEFVRLSNQFVVPVVDATRIRALVIVSLSVEVAPGESGTAFSLEPRLRDAFLQVMFDHANAGGFDGTFTSASTMSTLREALREAAQGVLGPVARDVLIIDMVRQDS